MRFVTFFALLILTAGAATAQTFRSGDPVIRRMWAVGMEQSRAGELAQVLIDSIGPRLAGTPGFRSAVDWLVATYRAWDVPVRTEQYGTWTGWRHGAVHLGLIAPRTQTLVARLLASPPRSGNTSSWTCRVRRRPGAAITSRSSALAAMLAYLAAEDQERVPRDRSVLPACPAHRGPAGVDSAPGGPPQRELI